MYDVLVLDDVLINQIVNSCWSLINLNQKERSHSVPLLLIQKPLHLQLVSSLLQYISSLRQLNHISFEFVVVSILMSTAGFSFGAAAAPKPAETKAPVPSNDSKPAGGFSFGASAPAAGEAKAPAPAAGEPSFTLFVFSPSLFCSLTTTKMVVL